MATAYKILGQQLPSANSLTTLYTVPGGTTPTATTTVISTISVCNQATTNATFGVAVRQAGAAQAAKQYLAMGNTVPANDTVVLTLGITLSATDVVSVSASTATVSFNLFGSEIS